MPNPGLQTQTLFYILTEISMLCTNICIIGYIFIIGYADMHFTMIYGKPFLP